MFSYLVLVEIFEVLALLFLRQLTPHATDRRPELTDRKMRISRFHLKPDLHSGTYNDQPHNSYVIIICFWNSLPADVRCASSKFRQSYPDTVL